MKTCFLAGMYVVIFFLSTRVCLAQDMDLSESMDVRPQYIGGMTGATIVNEPVVQPSIILNWGNLYVNTWMSMHLIDPRNIRKGDEVDLSAGYVYDVGVTKHNVMLSYYNLYPLSSSSGDLFAVRDTVMFPEISGWHSSLALELEIPENEQILSGGFLYKAETYREISIGKKKIIGSIAFGGHDGVYNLDPEIVSFVRGTIALPISMQLIIISPSLMLQLSANEGGLADNQVVLGMNISWP